jgi:hypothetical protein
MAREEPAPDTEVWAAGRRRTGQRSLSEAERGEIDRLARRHRRRGVAMLLSGPAVFLLCVAAWLLVPEANLGLALLSTGLFVGLLLLGVPMAIASRRWFSAGRTLFRDARAGVVDCFEGRREAGSSPAGAPEDLDPRTADLEILPHSALVWRARGERLAAPSYLERFRVAALPDAARVAAEWTEPVRTRDGDLIHVNRRDLSPAERTELARIANRLAFGPGWIVGVAAAWFVLVLLANVGRGTWGEQAVALALPGLATGVTAARLARDLRLAARLRRDGEAGQVVIVRGPTGESTPGMLGPPIEYLATSGFLWTSSGHPAGWRGTPTRRAH